MIGHGGFRDYSTCFFNFYLMSVEVKNKTICFVTSNVQAFIRIFVMGQRFGCQLIWTNMVCNSVKFVALLELFRERYQLDFVFSASSETEITTSKAVKFLQVWSLLYVIWFFRNGSKISSVCAVSVNPVFYHSSYN